MNPRNTKKVNKSNHSPERLNLASSLAGNFTNFIVNTLLPEAYATRTDTPYTRDQVFMHPAIGCVLVALELESIRNELYYNEQKNRTGKGCGHDLAVLISAGIHSFPKEHFEQLIDEVFVLRDAIVHGHLYKVNVVFNNDFSIKNYSNRWVNRKSLSQGDRKFILYVNQRTKKTKVLGLSVQPFKVKFEDLFITLIVLDILQSLLHRRFKYKQVVFGFQIPCRYFGYQGAKTQVPGLRLSFVLGHYYRMSSDPSFKPKILRTFKTLKNLYKDFVMPPSNEEEALCSETFLDNVCPKCGACGYQTPLYWFGWCRDCNYQTQEQRDQQPHYVESYSNGIW